MTIDTVEAAKPESWKMPRGDGLATWKCVTWQIRRQPLLSLVEVS